MKKNLITLGVLSLGIFLIFFSPTILIYCIAGFQIGTWTSDVSRMILEKLEEDGKEN